VSKSALEALKITGLLDNDGKVPPVEKMDPAELQEQINYYRQTRIERSSSDATASLSKNRDLAALVSSVSAVNAVDALLPSCFVYNRVYANDPLISLAETSSEIAKVHSQFLGIDTASLPDPHRVANKLHYFSRLAPLIERGFLTILPLEELHAAPTDELPVFYSEDWFRSDVPAHIHDFVHQSAAIHEVAPGPGGKGLLVLHDAPKDPTRGIAISFRGDEVVSGMSFYLLHTMQAMRKIDDDHFEFVKRLDWDRPPAKAEFDAWVYQSINKTIIARLSSMGRELSVADQLGATYLTESEFESKLCGLSNAGDLKPGQGIDAVNFLNANASCLNINDPLLLSRLKEKYHKLFDRWQLSLLSIADELTGESGNFNLKANQLFEKEVRPQLEELNTAVLKMAGGGAGAALLTAGTIGMALLSNAALPFAAVLGLGALAAGGRSIPSVAEYAAKRKGPAFIWKKLLK